MEQKKDSKHDVESKRPLFGNFALMLVLISLIIVFEWRTADDDGINKLNIIHDDFEELMDIPTTEQPPPPPPKQIKAINIIEVPDVEEIEEDIDVSLDIDMTENTQIEEFELTTEEPEEEIVEEVFRIVEHQPTPKGGYETFYKYIGENLKYPQHSLRSGIQGKVFVEFTINKYGKIIDPIVLKGISDDCDKEAIRVISNSPDWNAGKQRGNPVNVRMVIPVIFSIQNK